MRRLDMHALYRPIFRIWRARRMDEFLRRLAPRRDELLLDVGGTPATWLARPQPVRRIDCINLREIAWLPESAPGHQITTAIADACDLACADASYDIVFSNSVIEHVGDWDRQRAFAAEVRRVGGRLWIQTPAFECPIEPHYLAPFVHWLPVSWRAFVVRWLTPYGWIARPSRQTLRREIHDTRLLTRAQMAALFPDCEIWTECLAGILPKSHVAIRT